MSPEHAEAMAKRGIVYQPNPSCRTEPAGHPCVEGCGARVGWPTAKCGRCKLAMVQAIADRRTARPPRKHKCACDDPTARKVMGVCRCCYEHAKKKRAA